MAHRGRRSAAEVSLLQPLDASNIEALGRLKPPAGLTIDELRVWKTTVNSKPADWFGLEHIPMLMGYVTAAVAADIWERLSRDLDSKASDYPAKLAKYRQLAQRERKMVSLLGRGMRLTHQSAFRAAGSAPKGSIKGDANPWDVE